MYFSFPHVARLPARRLTDNHLTGITTNLGITHSEVNLFVTQGEFPFTLGKKLHGVNFMFPLLLKVI